MARTLTKEKPIATLFWEGLVDTVSRPDDIKSYDDSIWREKPVRIEKFCNTFIKEPLFPVQAGFAEAMVGYEPTEISTEFTKGLAFWGKGGGKDRSISKIQAYIAYWLLCLHDPQEYLRAFYGASLGINAPIDIANVSITAKQATNVYFKNFKAIVREVTNPKTGKNWFAEKGLDLRDGYDIQNNEVRFPHEITAHSLNSETNTGEGLTPIFVAFDEFGGFKPEKAFALLDALEETVISRFPTVGKVCVFSYKYYENDPMQVLYKREENNPRTYRSKAATWEVNHMRKKEDFAARYARNPEKSKMTYECEGGESEGGYVTKKYMLGHMFGNSAAANPIKGELISIKADHLLNLNFHSWFQGQPGRVYGVRADLAKGKVSEGGDAAGFSLVHLELMKPIIDAKLQADLMKEGIYLENLDSGARKGVVTDLAFQIVADRSGEIDISVVRRFILILKNQFKFNIIQATYDGWQSLESIQELKSQGVNAYEMSVDKKNDHYDTWKELMYQQLWKCYPNRIAKREAKELILNDKGRIDHPVKSWTRAVEEGNEKGSKDVMDANVGAGVELWKNISLSPDVFFG